MKDITKILSRGYRYEREGKNEGESKSDRL